LIEKGVMDEGALEVGCDSENSGGGGGGVCRFGPVAGCFSPA
jgi:hypothetical protein